MKIILKHSTYVFYIFAVALLLLSSCNFDDKNPEHQLFPGAHDSSSENSEPGTANKDSGMLQIKTKVLAWDAANNTHSTKILENLFAPQINFYGETVSGEEAVRLMQDFFNTHTEFKQRLDKSININEEANGTQTVSFTRLYTLNGKEYSSKSHLSFEKTGNQWKITAESEDSGGFSRFIRPKTIQGTDLNLCDKAAEAVFLSSDEVRKMLSEKYVKYSMEYKPGDPGNPSKNYWFWIFASAPGAGKTETYGRYEVSPKDGSLFRYDIVNDKPVKIESDAARVADLKKFCR